MLILCLAVIGIAAAKEPVDLPQDVINEGSCDAAGQETTYPGMCECGGDCCNSEIVDDGCPVDVVIGIDMCSCNNDTWTTFKDFTTDVVDALYSQFGISDSDNSARVHVFQFMDDNVDVVNFDVFTRKEISKAIKNMNIDQFRGKGTNLEKAITHAATVLKGSPRAANPKRQSAFAVITNGYSDSSLTSDQKVFNAAIGMDNGIDNLKMFFVAREDSSISNDAGTHTNEEVRQAFDPNGDSTIRLKDPVAPQNIVGNIECAPPPPPSYEKQCTCECDVPMGCHGERGPAGPPGPPGPCGAPGVNGSPGETGGIGKAGEDGAQGPEGGCGMPGEAGNKGEPGADGVPGEDGSPGPEGAVGAPGLPGDAGDKGPDGDGGDPGEQGDDGVQGNPGPPGPSGEQGNPGELNEETLKWLVNKIFIEELNSMGLQSPMTG